VTFTSTEARDAVNGVVNDAWLASGVTSGFEMQWDDVKADPPGEDVDGNAETYARTTVRTFTSEQETLGGPGVRKHQTEGQVVVQVFTPSGDGHTLSDAIVEVLKAAVRNKRVGNLWFFDAVPREVGQEGAHFQTNFVAGFRYEERS